MVVILVIKNIKKGVKNLRFLTTLVLYQYVMATYLIITAICLTLRQLALYNCHLPLFPIYILISVLISHIYILGYLLKYLLSKASLLVLLFLFLKVLLLYFLPLLGLFKALEYLPPIALTILRLRFLLPQLASIPLTPIRLSSVSLASIILRQIVSQRSFILYFNSFLSLTIILTSLLYVSLPPLYRPRP